MAVSLVSAGRLTATGSLLSVVDPLPNWPRPLCPQAKAAPSEVNAALWRRPAAMAVASVPVGRATAMGTRLSVVVPLPSWPKLLPPQARAVSSEVNTRL